MEFLRLQLLRWDWLLHTKEIGAMVVRTQVTTLSPQIEVFLSEEEEDYAMRRVLAAGVPFCHCGDFLSLDIASRGGF